jgi:hypothetical protein
MSAGHLSMRNKFLMHGVALFLILTAHPVKATETAPEPPQHLTLARQLQANVAPNQNSYRHSEQISLPQDGPTKGYTMFADCSGLVIALLDQPHLPPLGAGEAACAAVPAALANAVYDACGARLRNVPFTPDRLKVALARGYA